MRLFVAAVTVVATFVVVVLLILRLFPPWSRLGWYLRGDHLLVRKRIWRVGVAWKQHWQKGPGNASRRRATAFPERQPSIFCSRNGVVTITVAVTIRDTERGIHRSFKNDWFVGLGSACVALGYAAKAFWIFRRNWHLWAVISALLALFTAIAIPVSPKWRRCHCCLWGRWPMSNCSLLLWYLTGSLVGIRGDVAHRSC